MPVNGPNSCDVFSDPGVVAVVGASDDPHKIGGRPVHYLRTLGFEGQIYPVNPHRSVVQGLSCYPGLAELPQVPDVAIIALSGGLAADAVVQCSELGVGGVVVFSSGFGETGQEEGRQLQRRMVEAGARSGMRLVGPNTQGLANFSSGAVLGFSTMFIEEPPRDGPVAIISQSGAMCSVPYGMLRSRGIGVRYAHSTGNSSDVTVAELTRSVVKDPAVKLVLLYLEDISDIEMLERAAHDAASRDVYIVALVGGRSPAGAKAAQSHTGALASENRVVDALLKRLGIWRAHNMRDLVSYAEVYLQGWTPAGAGVGIVSNSGAVGVMFADVAADVGLKLPTFAPETHATLSDALPAFASADNPVDVTAAVMTDPSLIGTAVRIVDSDPGVAATVLGIPVAGLGYAVDQFASEMAGIATATDKPTLVVAPQDSVRKMFTRHGLVTFEDESESLKALAQLLHHRQLMMRAKKRSLRPRWAPLGTSSRTLNEFASLRRLAEAGLPVVETVLCKSPDEAVNALQSLGGPIVLKGCTSSLAHKSDIGLVHLGLVDAADVLLAAQALYETAATHAVPLDGLLAAPMIRGSLEVIVGAHSDVRLGPIVLVGAGGTYVEAMPDVAVLVPPFSLDDVCEVIDGLRIAPVLRGIRNEEPLDIAPWTSAAVALGDLMTAAGNQVSSVDANPMILGTLGQGAGVVVDAVVTETL